MSATLYETDLAAWALNSAALLREGAELDEERREQIAEELEGMAKNDRRELSNRTIVLIVHLLKIRFQSQKHSRSWDLTVAVQRGLLKDLFAESPSLRHGYQEMLPPLYARARELGKIETNIDTFPEQNPFTPDQILNG